MTIDRLKVEAFLNTIDQLRLMVVGDLMLDEYLWGATERISPEAPVQVVDLRKQDLRLGGAGNVIANLRALGCDVLVASVIGEDDDGRMLLQQLKHLKADISGVHHHKGRQTSRKTRILANNQQLLRIDRESREAIDSQQELKLLTFIRSRVTSVDAILVSDYLKGVLTETLLRELIAIGKKYDIPIVIDPKGSDYTKYRGATVLTPNRKEAQTASGIKIADEESLLRAGKKLREDLEVDALVLTRSEQGMSLFLASGEVIYRPTQARDVFDVSGAGDTVLSNLGIGMAAGMSIPEAADLANIAAGIVVGKVGTSTVEVPEILEAVGRKHKDTDLKIKSPTLLADILSSEQLNGRRVVFTNGCFDLLHAGHVHYLERARRLGELLVVGLNSDASIRRIKGPKRPLILQEDRSHLLAALNCVDYIVLFDEDTPLRLIELLRPDVLVKGGDYTPDNVVGAELVKSYGGEVKIIRYMDDRSTTGIIERILERYHEDEPRLKSV